MLTKIAIQDLIKKQRLIEGFIDLETQATPNGIDLTAEKVFSFAGPGAVDFSNKERVLPQIKELAPVKKDPQDTHGWWKLAPGAYKVRTNETVNLPNNLTAIAFTRTSLLRMGAFCANGVWDAGFCGKSEFLLTVVNPAGIELKQNARVIQLVFFPVEATDSYNGIYKGLK